MPNQYIKIPEPTLRRLPWYLAYAKMARKHGEQHLSSTQIAQHIGVDASKVAKDFSYIAISGKTRVGYELEELITALDGFLGFSNSHKAFLFGAGSLGSSLLDDDGLRQYGLDLVSAFDAKETLSGTFINHIPIHHINDFKRLQEQTGVEIAVLTVPVEVAQEVADLMVECGIRAIWNFTPYPIRVPDGIVIQNTSIYAHLAVMFNRLREEGEKER